MSWRNLPQWGRFSRVGALNRMISLLTIDLWQRHVSDAAANATGSAARSTTTLMLNSR